MSFIAGVLPALFGGAGAAGGFTLAQGLGAASGIVGLIGAGMRAAGQRREAEAAAESAEFDAKAKEQQAQAERDAAGAEADDYRRRQMRIIAERRSNAGAAGLTGAGSPLLVEESMLREIALGTGRIGHQGFVRESRMQDSAALDRRRAGYTREAGRRAAGATLLTGFGNFAGNLAESWG